MFENNGLDTQNHLVIGSRHNVAFADSSGFIHMNPFREK